MQNAVPPRRRGWAEAVRATGFLAVLAGAAAVTIVAGIAIAKGTDTASTVAGSAIGVIGSIVGAYLGLKLGGDQTRSAIEAQREEAVKAQVYAAHLPEGGPERSSRGP